MLLIEHDMPLVFRFARAITVLAEGAVIAQGPPAAIAANPLVRAAYLGSRGGVRRTWNLSTWPAAMARPASSTA